MPHDALIADLDDLRETYNGRLRAANSLVASLKGLTGALGKAARSLYDYAEMGAGVEGDKLSGARQAFGDLRLRDEAIDPLLPDLRREAKALTALNDALKDALAALRADPVDAVRLGRAYKALQEARTQDGAITALLPALYDGLQGAQRSLGGTFGQALRSAFAAQGLAVTGQPPRFEIGRFEVEADFSARTATVSYGKELVIKKVALGVEPVLSAYQRAIRAVTGRNEDGARWIEGLYQAWDIAQRKRGRAEGRANIVDCYYELSLLRQSKAFRAEPLKSRFADYSRAQFAHDFFEITNQQRRAYKGRYASGHNATKDQTGTAERSMWIVEGAHSYDGRYIGDVTWSSQDD